MCEFCQNHERGDTLYEPSDWDGGIGFDYIRDIKYCPICGRKLDSVTQTETQNSNLTFEKDECAKEYEELGLKELKELIEADRKTEPQKKEVEWVYNKRERLWYPYSNGELLFKDEPTISKMEQVDKDINVRSKDKPSDSEKPNNCEPKICDTCRYYNSNIPCGSTPSACKEADKFAEEFVDGLKKLKPTISKMEQVDKDINVRSKNEPQRDCFLCKWLGDVDVCGRCRNRNLFAEADTEPKPKDEPQTNKDFKVTYTCSFTECDNFKNFGFGEKCIECKRKQSEAKHKDEPQTERSE